MTLNLDAVYFLCRDVHPLLVKSTRPTVVNVASVAGVQSTGSGAAYAMSKAGGRGRGGFSSPCPNTTFFSPTCTTHVYCIRA